MAAKKSDPVRRPWDSPKVSSVGTVADVLRGGGGKLTLAGNDTGDTRKPKGQG